MAVTKLSRRSYVPVRPPRSKSPNGAGNKYRNVKTEVDGILFDSKREAARFRELRLLERANRISELRLQVKFLFVINAQRVGSYTADFVYLQDGKQIVEDAKGVKTPVYNLKKRLMRALHGVEIVEV